MSTKAIFLIIFSALLVLNAQEISDRQLETDNNCECVYFYLCDKNNYIIKNGENLLDVRIKDVQASINRTVIVCSDSTKWCCKSTPTNETSVVNSTPTPTPIIDATKIECGKKYASEKFPWLVEIFQIKKVNKKLSVFTCSGSLIRPNIVLTSNHCVRANADYVVVLGNDTDFHFHEVTDVANKRKVTKKILHEDYYSGGLYNDIALLVLEEPFEITDEYTVNTVCLPNYQQEFNGNHHCLAAGFNTKQLGKVKIVNLTIVDNGPCQEGLRSTRLGKGFNLHSSFLCASGTKDNDNCAGDGGTPLICQNSNGNYVQVGIVSWGVECENPEVPGLYANIANLKPWIDRKVKHQNTLLSAMRNASDESKSDKTIETENNCECVLYYLCDDQNYIITNGSNLIDNRNKDEGMKEPIPCSNPLERCCKVKTIDGSKATEN